MASTLVRLDFDESNAGLVHINTQELELSLAQICFRLEILETTSREATVATKSDRVGKDKGTAVESKSGKQKKDAPTITQESKSDRHRRKNTKEKASEEAILTEPSLCNADEEQGQQQRVPAAGEEQDLPGASSSKSAMRRTWPASLEQNVRIVEEDRREEPNSLQSEDRREMKNAPGESEKRQEETEVDDDQRNTTSRQVVAISDEKLKDAAAPAKDEIKRSKTAPASVLGGLSESEPSEPSESEMSESSEDDDSEEESHETRTRRKKKRGKSDDSDYSSSDSDSEVRIEAQKAMEKEITMLDGRLGKMENTLEDTSSRFEYMERSLEKHKMEIMKLADKYNEADEEANLKAVQSALVEIRAQIDKITAQCIEMSDLTPKVEKLKLAQDDDQESLRRLELSNAEVFKIFESLETKTAHQSLETEKRIEEAKDYVISAMMHEINMSCEKIREQEEEVWAVFKSEQTEALAENLRLAKRQQQIVQGEVIEVQNKLTKLITKLQREMLDIKKSMTETMKGLNDVEMAASVMCDQVRWKHETTMTAKCLSCNREYDDCPTTVGIVDLPMEKQRNTLLGQLQRELYTRKQDSTINLLSVKLGAPSMEGPYHTRKSSVFGENMKDVELLLRKWSSPSNPGSPRKEHSPERDDKAKLSKITNPNSRAIWRGKDGEQKNKLAETDFKYGLRALVKTNPGY